jgi:hypothetical protein
LKWKKVCNIRVVCAPVVIGKLVDIGKWYIDDVGGRATVMIGSTNVNLGSTGDDTSVEPLAAAGEVRERHRCKRVKKGFRKTCEVEGWMT